MADTIVRLKVESQEYDQKLKRAQEGLTRYADECRKVGGTLEVVEKDTLEYVRALGQMDTVSRTATGKLAELKKTFTELSVVYKDLSKEEKQSPFGKALSSSLDQLKVRINDSKAQLDDVKNSLNGGSGLSGALDSIASKFGMNISQLTKFGSVVGVTTTALQVAKDAFFQSESGIDEWGRTVEGTKGAYNVFLDTLNNGNWSNFFENLQTAIKGGRDLYDIFDRLGSIKSNNAAAIAIVQQQIAQLRLAKQQGENVDAQLKEATARLAQLQKQSITAGKAAGSKSAFEVIRNGVNSAGGAGVNDATINYVIDRIMKNGQSEFDKFKNNYQILRQKGMVTRTQTINDSQGGTYERQYKVFDINALTKEQQKQYSLAKAITEGETRIQKGIAAYAQAVQEGTASAREEFKGNRYALQGSGGGSGKKSGSGSGTDVQTYAENSITAQTKLVQELTKQWNDASEEMKNGYLYQLVEAEQKLKSMKESDAFNKKGIELLYSMKNGDGASPVGIADGLMPDIKKIEEELAKNPIKLNIEIDPEKIKSIKSMTALQKTASETAKVVDSIGQAFNAIEDPAAKVAGTVMQAIASVALGYASALKYAGEVGGPWGWIAFAATGLATMMSTISAIHSATGYAQGGIVKGNSYSGDNIYGGPDAMVNAGELVLTKAQQSNLASQLQGGGMGGWKLTTKLAGTDLLVSLERTLQKQGYGRLATWQ